MAPEGEWLSRHKSLERGIVEGDIVLLDVTKGKVLEAKETEG